MRQICAFGAVVAALAIGACAGPASGPARETSPGPRPGPPGTAYRLVEIAFLTANRGYGEFVAYHSSPCRIAVSATFDGGARFSAPVPVATWRCGQSLPASALAFDAEGDGFLYGPDLFVTHDGGRTWAASRFRGEVLAVAPVGRSVWLVQADCPLAEGPERCPLRLLTSADGGRTWAPAPTQPPAVAAAYPGLVQAGPAQGQSWLVRTAPTAGYLASLTPQPPSRGPVGLWFTGDGGRTWTRRTTPCGSGFGAALAAAPGGVLYAVCGGQPGAGEQAKTVERSADGGRTWVRQASCGIGHCPAPLAGYLGQIAAPDPRTVYMVGARSPLLVSRDDGATWHLVAAVTAGSDAGTSQVIFLGRSTGMVVGVDDKPPYHPQQPTIWRTSDSGRHWTAVHPVVA